MKRKLLLTVFISLLIISTNAQVTETEEDLKTVSSDTTDGWDTGGVFTLTFGQTAFSDHWAAGGTPSISVNGIAGLFANYKKGKLTWDNTLDLGYGTQGLKTTDEYDFQKTDDRLDFATKLGYQASGKVYYAALINLKTQMTDGFDYGVNPDSAISKLFAPAYLLAAAGIDYKPNKSFSAFVAPITSKTTLVLDEDLSNNGAFGVDSGNTIRNEFGGYIKTVYTKDIIKNVNLTTKLDLFSNYLDKPGNIDINWDVLIAMKINKFLTANISTQLIYDHDVKFTDTDDNGDITGGPGPRVQFKEVLGIGLSFKF